MKILPASLRRAGLLLSLLATSAHAQQAIVTLPSADITGEGQFFVMQESQLRLWGDRQYWAGTYFLTFGLDKHVELAATLFDFGVNYDGTTGNSTLAVGFKANIPLVEELWASGEVKLTFGAMAMASVVGRGLGAWAYALGSFRVPLLGTRLAAGASYATRQFYGKDLSGRFFDGVSALFSVEQPVPIPGVRGLSLVAEWFSGQHELSNLIVGVTWHPTSTWIFVLGWKVPTQDARFGLNEMALVGEVGVFFPSLFEGRRGHEDDHH